MTSFHRLTHPRHRLLIVTACSLASLAIALSAFSQRGGELGRRGFPGGRRPTADRSQYPIWELESEFEKDVFTFARVQFDSLSYRPGGQWDNDFPDSDWNFSARLHQLTTLRVDPNGKVVRLTDESLPEYPFLFMSNANEMVLAEEEVVALRRYLLGGGFLMVDDFWGPRAWRHIHAEMQRVFPDRQVRELPANHELFTIVYRLKGVPQVPSIRAWQRGETFEYWHGDPEGDEAPHFWAYFDDSGNIMALLCQNNDIADGWEREGENIEYFKEYSVRVSYPLGINIVTYAMTH